MLEDKFKPKTAISQMGEFGLIDLLTQQTPLYHKSTKLGVGDDAAILELQKNTVISTDMLVEGVHFDLSYTPLKHLGYKAVVVNLSDVFAMNAQATHITVSLAISNRFTVEDIEEIYEGIKLACQIYKVDLVGGDTTSSQSGLIISITAVGQVEPHKITQRKGANPNDLLILSGDIGSAYMGLQVLRRENEVFQVNPQSQPDLSLYSYLIERQLKPEARKDIVSLLNKLEVVPSSMIDVSDGLSSEILHLCKHSEVGAAIYEDKIPLDPQMISVCEEFKLDSTTIALSGGEDYELLFTINQKEYPKIKGNPNFTVIGHIAEPGFGKRLITRDGQEVEIVAQGWNSFNSGEE